MKIKIMIILVLLLAISCSNDSKSDVAEFPIIDTVWTKGAYQHPVLDRFIKYNMWDPSYLELNISNSLESTVLLRGRIKFLSGHTLWTFVIDSSEQAGLNQIIITPDSNGIFRDTIHFNLDSQGSSFAPIFIETDTASSYVKYAVFAIEHDSTMVIYDKSNPRDIPNLMIKSLKGNILTNSDLKNQVVVINWWATWCKPCVAEMPGLNTLVQKYKDVGVRFIAVHNESPEKISKFLNSHEFKYEHYFADSVNSALFGEGFPRNIILNRESKVVFDRVGGSESTYKEIEAKLEIILDDMDGL